MFAVKLTAVGNPIIMEHDCATVGKATAEVKHPM